MTTEEFSKLTGQYVAGNVSRMDTKSAEKKARLQQKHDQSLYGVTAQDGQYWDDADSSSDYRLQGADAPEIYHEMTPTGDTKNVRSKVYQQVAYENQIPLEDAVRIVDQQAEARAIDQEYRQSPQFQIDKLNNPNDPYYQSQTLGEGIGLTGRNTGGLTSFDVYHAGDVATKAGREDIQAADWEKYKTGEKGYFGRELLNNPEYVNKMISEGYMVPGEADDPVEYAKQKELYDVAKEQKLGLHGHETVDPRVAQAMQQTSYAYSKSPEAKAERAKQAGIEYQKATQGWLEGAAKAAGTGFVKELAVDLADWVGDTTNMYDIGTEEEKTEMVNKLFNYVPATSQETVQQVEGLNNIAWDSNQDITTRLAAIGKSITLAAQDGEMLGSSLGVLAAWLIPGMALTKGHKVGKVMTKIDKGVDAGKLSRTKAAGMKTKKLLGTKEGVGYGLRQQSGMITGALGNINDQYETFVENNNGVELQGADKAEWFARSFGVQMFNQNLDAITAVSIMKSPGMLQAAKQSIKDVSEKAFGKAIVGMSVGVGKAIAQMPKEAAQEYTQGMMELYNERFGAEEFKDTDTFTKFITNPEFAKEKTVDALLGAGGSLQFSAMGAISQASGKTKDVVTETMKSEKDKLVEVEKAEAKAQDKTTTMANIKLHNDTYTKAISDNDVTKAYSTIQAMEAEVNKLAVNDEKSATALKTMLNSKKAEIKTKIQEQVKAEKSMSNKELVALGAGIEDKKAFLQATVDSSDIATDEAFIKRKGKALGVAPHTVDNMIEQAKAFSHMDKSSDEVKGFKAKIDKIKSYKAAGYVDQAQAETRELEMLFGKHEEKSDELSAGLTELEQKIDKAVKQGIPNTLKGKEWSAEYSKRLTEKLELPQKKVIHHKDGTNTEVTYKEVVNKLLHKYSQRDMKDKTTFSEGAYGDQQSYENAKKGIRRVAAINNIKLSTIAGKKDSAKIKELRTKAKSTDAEKEELKSLRKHSTLDTYNIDQEAITDLKKKIAREEKKLKTITYVKDNGPKAEKSKRYYIKWEKGKGSYSSVDKKAEHTKKIKALKDEIGSYGISSRSRDKGDVEALLGKVDSDIAKSTNAIAKLEISIAKAEKALEDEDYSDIEKDLVNDDIKLEQGAITKQKAHISEVKAAQAKVLEGRLDYNEMTELDAAMVEGMMHSPKVEAQEHYAIFKEYGIHMGEDVNANEALESLNKAVNDSLNESKDALKDLIGVESTESKFTKLEEGLKKVDLGKKLQSIHDSTKELEVLRYDLSTTTGEKAKAALEAKIDAAAKKIEDTKAEIQNTANTESMLDNSYGKSLLSDEKFARRVTQTVKNMKKDDGDYSFMNADPDTYLQTDAKNVSMSMSIDLDAEENAALKDYSVKKADKLFKEIKTNDSTSTAAAVVSNSQAFIFLKDPATDLIISKDADGNHSINPNVALTLSLVGDEFMKTRASELIFNTWEDTKNIWGMPEGTSYNSKAHRITKSAGANLSFVANELGTQARKALGIKFKEDATEEMVAMFDGSLGYKVLQMQMAEGRIKRHTGKDKNATSVIKAEDVATAMKTFMPGTAVKQTQNRMMVQLSDKMVKDNGLKKLQGNQEMEALLDTFGAKHNEKGPRFSPRTTKERENRTLEARRTHVVKDNIGDKTVTAVDKHENLEYNLDTEAIDKLIQLEETNKKAFNARLGIVDLTLPEWADDKTLDSVDSQDAVNTEKLRAWEDIKALRESMKGNNAKPNTLYFNWFMAKSGRLFIDSNTINPQTEKQIQRWLITAKEQEAEIDINNDKQEMEVFKVAISQGLGIDIDKQGYENSIKDGTKILSMSEEELNIAEKTIMNEGKYTTKAGLVIKSEHLGHTVATLNNIRKYKNAKNGKFTTNQVLELDGITNGLIAKLLQIPLADINKTIKHLRRGGIVIGVTEKIGYLDYVENKDEKDSYQNVSGQLKEPSYEDWTKRMPKRLFNSMTALMPKIFSEEDASEITKEGRDIAKDPTMHFQFGATLRSIKANVGNKMSDGFADKMLEAANRIANGKDVTDYPAADLVKVLAYHTEKKDAKVFAANLAKLLKTKSYEEISFATLGIKTSEENKAGHITTTKPTLQRYFKEFTEATYGEQVAGVLKNEFGDLVESNRIITNNTKTQYAGFKIILEDNIARIEENQGKPISLAQERELLQELADAFPTVESPFGGLIEFIDNKLQKSDEASKLSIQAAVNNKKYKGKSDSKSSVTLQIVLRDIEAAVSSGAVLPIHFTDASVMAEVMNDYGFTEVHDAKVLGITQAVGATKAYNKGFIDIAANYNLLEKYHDSLVKTMSMMTQGQIDRVNAMFAASQTATEKEANPRKKYTPTRFSTDQVQEYNEALEEAGINPESIPDVAEFNRLTMEEILEQGLEYANEITKRKQELFDNVIHASQIPLNKDSIMSYKKGDIKVNTWENGPAVFSVLENPVEIELQTEILETKAEVTADTVERWTKQARKHLVDNSDLYPVLYNLKTDVVTGGIDTIYDNIARTIGKDLRESATQDILFEGILEPKLSEKERTDVVNEIRDLRKAIHDSRTPKGNTQEESGTIDAEMTGEEFTDEENEVCNDGGIC